MRKSSIAIPMVAALGVVFATCTGPGQPSQSGMLAATAHPIPSSYEGANAVVEEYCTRCHSERQRRGELVLEDFDIANAPENAAAVEKMINKLRVGMMPPSGARRPEAAVLLAVASELETRVDRAAADNPNPGTRTFQRLNRAEYGEAVRDLLGLKVDVAQFLPLDTKSANFDNIADVQMPSTTVMEGYLRASGQIVRIALGDPNAEISNTIYRVPRVQSQRERVQGAPFGTRGGLSVVHNFPADGKYVFHIMPYAAVEGEVFARTYGDEQIEVSIEGERVALLSIDRWMSESEPSGLNIRTDSIQVTAGPKRVTAAFVRQYEGAVDDLIRPIDHTLADGQIGVGLGVTTQQHLQRMTVLGPFEITGVSETPARNIVFSCRPTSPEEARPCAEEIIGRMAEKAYRRPVNQSDVDGLLPFYDRGAQNSGFEGGIRTALQAVLTSPHFLFRMEERPADVQPGEIYRISDVDLASRLSFFLWGAPPDEELLRLARAGDLSDSAELRRQVSRMLDDPKVEALATRFAGQWLRLQDLDNVQPDALTYPYFDQTLADAMRRETELLFSHIVEEDRSVLDLLTADYTFVNERLARHYGIAGVTGPEFQQVQYPDDRRRGLLGHGSILTLTSHPDRTSPVLRGKWVMEVILGSPPPPPPPNVPTFEETEGASDGRFLTVREVMEQHRANPACVSCHNVIDPIGLALENFDPTGAWRSRDGGNLINTASELYDGTPIDGAAELLREAVLSRPEVFYRILAENLMAYALGRRVEYFDMPTIRAITREAANNDYRVSSFVLGVVESPAFLSARATVVDQAGQN